MINALIALIAVCVIGSIAYWLRQAWIAAERVKKVFQPRVQAPTDQDLQRWREQQQRFENLDDDNLPMLLKRQAE